MLVALAVALLVAVAACGESDGEAPTLAPTPQVEITIFYPFDVDMPSEVNHYGKIAGTLTYEGERALPEGAQIQVSLWRPEEGFKYRRSANYGFYTLERTEQFPVSFVMHCDPCGISTGQEYVARVDITDPTGSPWQDGFFVEAGSFLFRNAIKTIVIDSNGLAKDIEIPVVPGPTLTGTIEPGEGTPTDPVGGVYLWDVSQRNSEPILLASKEIEVGEQFPIPFSIDYHPAYIDPHGIYVLQAELRRFRGRGCQGVYRHKEVYEVITRDNPTHDIQLDIVRVDKEFSEEVAHVTGTVAYPNRHEDVGQVSNDDENAAINEALPPDSTIPILTRVSMPTPNPKNPWYLGIVDLSEGCTFA